MRWKKLTMGISVLGLAGLVGSMALAQTGDGEKPAGKGKTEGKESKKGKFKGKGGFGGFGGPGRGFGGSKRGGFGGPRESFYGPRGRHASRHGGRGFHGRHHGWGRHRGHHGWRGGHRGWHGRHHGWRGRHHHGWRGHRGWHGRHHRPGRMGRFGGGWGRPGMGHFGKRPGAGAGFGLFKDLTLTEEQQKKFKDLGKAQMEKTRAAMKKAFESSREEMRKGIKDILTPEQYKKYEAAREKLKAKAPPKGKGADKKKSDQKKEQKKEADAEAANPIETPARLNPRFSRASFIRDSEVIARLE